MISWWVIPLIVAGWLVGNLIGWYNSEYKFNKRPFNWRVFLGPLSYGRWVDNLGDDDGKRNK